jgi:hypothetical protein
MNTHCHWNRRSIVKIHAIINPQPLTLWSRDKKARKFFL